MVNSVQLSSTTRIFCPGIIIIPFRYASYASEMGNKGYSTNAHSPVEPPTTPTTGNVDNA